MKVIKPLLPLHVFGLALSGGQDSLATAAILKQQDYEFVAIHFNGNFIEQDKLAQKQVEKFCLDKGIELHVMQGVNDYKKGSKEDYCRVARYAAMNKAALELGIFDIITAHNLDDCVTSYMWNCLRGHPDFTPIRFQTHFDAFVLTRPFLLTSKKELKDFGLQVFPDLLEYVTEDELNQDLNLTRNWLREKIVPAIHQKPHFNLNTVVKKIVENKLKKFLDMGEKK